MINKTDSNVTFFETRSEEETFNLAKTYSQIAKKGDVIILSGDLGAGKSVFTRGFANGLEIKDYITSPTFTLMQEYEIPGKDYKLVHIDAYRIDSNEAIDIGMEEAIVDNIALIEWGELIQDILPTNYLHIDLQRDNEKGFDYRLIKITDKR